MALLFPIERGLAFPLLTEKRCSLLGIVGQIPTHLRTTAHMWESYPRPTPKVCGVRAEHSGTPRTHLFSPVPIAQLV